MTYTQLRRALSAVARHGEDGAPTSLLPIARWLALRGAGCVAYLGDDRWAITRLGCHVIAGKSLRRQSKRQPRRTPAIGHATTHQHSQQARSA